MRDMIKWIYEMSLKKHFFKKYEQKNLKVVHLFNN